MTTAATSLLGLALPVTGELSGTWGDTVNNSITALLDSAVAGTTTLSADVDVTLTTTTLAANQAREAIILWTAAGTVTRYITAPAQSKIYAVLNKSSTQSIVLRGVGPTTGVTILAGKQAMVAWDGTDYVEISSGYVDGPATSTDNAVARFDGTDGKLLQNSVVIIADTTGNMTGVGTLSSGAITSSSLTATRVLFAGTSGLIQDDADLTFNGTILTSTGFAGPLNGTVGATTANTGAFTDLSFSGTGTFSGGTANGVTYLNGSKVLTSGTALTFSNGNFLVNGAASGSALSGDASVAAIRDSATANVASYKVIGGSSNTQIELFGSGSTTGLWTSTNTPMLFAVNNTEQMRLTSTGLGIGTSSPATKLHVTLATAYVGRFAFDATYYTDIGYGGTNTVAPSNPFRYWELNNTEAMRLTSTGLGIGTSSPAYKLDVVGNVGIARIQSTGAGQNAQLNLQSTVATWSVGQNLTFTSTGTLEFYNGSMRLALDSSGNLGLGVTPSAWGTIFKVFQTSNGVTFSGRTDTQQLNAAVNWYFDGSSSRYIANGFATRYLQESGSHSWYNAPSGTAGNPITFTQAMTLDASGNLLVGDTVTAGSRLSFGKQFLSNNGYANAIRVYDNGEASSSQTSNSYGMGFVNGGQLSLTAGTGGSINLYTANTERMRLDSSGNLGLGVTPSAWNGNYKALQIGNRASFASDSNLSTQMVNNAYNDAVGWKYIGSSQASFYQTYQGAHLWFNAPSGTAGAAITFTQAMTLDASGNLKVGTTDAGGRVLVARSAVPTTYSKNTAYLQLGAGEETLNGYHLITFGYTAAANTYQPAFIGYTETSNSGNTYGDLIFGTRSVFTDTAPSERMRLDSSGNLGLGVTPSAWDAAGRINVPNNGALIAQGTSLDLGTNWYFNAGFKYATTATATRLVQTGGAYQFFNAPSGTAGNAITFTQAMTLDASGNLLVGTTNTIIWNTTNTGVVIGGASTPAIQVSRNGDATVLLNRNSSDGTIQVFARQGISVGTISVTASATAYNTSSDYRLKNITGPITTSGAYIDSLKPVEGTWKADGSTFVGLIAHETQEVSRTTVATGTKDGEQMQGMDYSSAEIIANLIAEIQDLRKRLAAAGI